MMSIDGFFRWALFCAGIITAIFAGYMFYIDNVAAGAAWLAVTVGFLCFSTRVREDSDSESSDDDPQTDKDLHDLAVLIANLAVMNLKNIGRTVPPGTKEIEDIESKLNSFLDLMPVAKSEREEINEEFERLRNRTRRKESDRAIFSQLGIRN
ncbi:MAG: hypothetical protein IJU31_04900 [Synergistaceae bacterium]|nr:hypothetical protein [Synergistaceae bacterium]